MMTTKRSSFALAIDFTDRYSDSPIIKAQNTLSKIFILLCLRLNYY